MKRLDLAWLLLFCGISAVLLFPGTRTEFTRVTNAHPYLLGFLKFAVMATMGELAAVRIVNGEWKILTGMPWKILIWGVIGMLIVLMFQVYTGGLNAVVQNGYIPLSSGGLGTFLKALLTSMVMNLTFAPVFMAAHRISDTYIDMRASGEAASLGQVIDKIDWGGFLRFVIGKTIPFFWIPAHTITFLLPGEFRVLYAAYLSIALGAILAYARRRTTSVPVGHTRLPED